MTITELAITAIKETGGDLVGDQIVWPEGTQKDGKVVDEGRERHVEHTWTLPDGSVLYNQGECIRVEGVPFSEQGDSPTDADGRYIGYRI